MNDLIVEERLKVCHNCRHCVNTKLYPSYCNVDMQLLSIKVVSPTEHCPKNCW